MPTSFRRTTQRGSLLPLLLAFAAGAAADRPARALIDALATRLLGAVLPPLAARQRSRSTMVPLLRAYIRHGRLAAVKRMVWSRVVEPYLVQHSYASTAQTEFGSWLYVDTIDIIQRYIYYFGIWEPNLTRWIAGQLSAGDTFVDVGANIGYYSLLAASAVGDSGSVVAIEASPRIFRLLERNVSRNACRNVRAVNMAASDRETTLRLFAGGAENIGETTTLEGLGLEPEGDIAAAPLGAILRPDELRAARLVKIDVEGAEWAVVAGLLPLLGACRGDLEIIVEVDPQLAASQGKQVGDFVAAFGQAGFHAYNLENDYSPLSYLPPPTAQRPERVSEPIDWETQLIFSRRDADWL